MRLFGERYFSQSVLLHGRAPQDRTSHSGETAQLQSTLKGQTPDSEDSDVGGLRTVRTGFYARA